MIPDDRDDLQQAWESEYAAWCEEQEQKDLDTLNRLLRAAGEGTVYDPRDSHADE